MSVVPLNTLITKSAEVNYRSSTVEAVPQTMTITHAAIARFCLRHSGERLLAGLAIVAHIAGNARHSVRTEYHYNAADRMLAAVMK